MPNFSELVDAYKKIPTSLFFAIGFVLGLILFSPDSWIEKFSLSDFLVKYRVWLGPAFLCVLAILVSRTFTFISDSVIGLQIKRERLNNLKTLTRDEKEYLRIFVVNDTATISREISDGIIGSLESKGIVYRTSNLSSHWKTFPYSLQPWARKYLKEQPKLLE
ncbi:super-infection exclusion protein B [Klebsiella pneumoniae]|uniref:super-infection exclusion protein B n=1 Tax=Klebsiella TaxID=570 RepID=UPI000F6D59BF|nr:super-infection exclusion protein B [Klebsiella aerogenes]EKZ5231640.1 superinfection exclusion B family protein [Klebsiella pneumoniae]HCI6526994.1 superinfection exclusion B family protein [Klebsiella quasipneumoniae subsp. quasipneumoniae]MCP6147548.1 superinfection exclusion B family protein [Klebsiella pneumoniae]VEI09587.1 Uncharacterised protein [Klebsiella aerogenes]HBT5338714.1 hypothetical protein [Klebsiella pneumoniae]